MQSKPVKFKNNKGVELNGKLEFPSTQAPHNFVLFAHCFTCNKNFFAVKNISDALTSKGFGVLRFDFTGLGESEGEFEDTNFSGNVEDLIAAANFLEVEYMAPSLLVGHSLGGAAVLFAAKELESVKAVATLGAPSSIGHVKHLLQEDFEKIQSEGKARVNIGGRTFTITEQFLKDLENKDLEGILKDLNKSLLIMHSPQDTIVSIKNAEEIYVAAKHPKSFISLDGADHLISNKKDSQYAGDIIGSWASRYLDFSAPAELETSHNVVAKLGAEGYTTKINAGHHNFVADEPIKAGGNDFGPNPYELVSAGLAACTSMTIQMYARRKGWKIDSVETHIDYSKDYVSDCDNCENDGSKIDTFKREIHIEGDLEEKQFDRLLEIANKCPVHKTLHSPTQILTKLKSS